MRSIPAVLAFLALTAPTRAGIYNTIETTPDLPAEKIRSQVLQLRAVALPPKGPLDPGSLRALYLKQAAQLERERDNGTFSTLDCVNLGACYLRLGQVSKAIKLLGSCPDHDHFLIQLNLASAYFLSGDYFMAVRHEELALDHWPVVWATFSKTPKSDQLEWYRRCELLFLHLLRSRRAESSRGNRGELVEVDPLFPGLRFGGAGPKGAYEAGGIAREVRDKLPSDAIGVVLQFALWYPQDMRIYWLLGELLNANGYVQFASEIIKELVDVGLPFKDLHEHRKVLDRAMKLVAKFPLNSANQALLLATLLSIPHGSLSPPGVGAAASTAANAAAMAWAAVPPVIGAPPGFGGTLPGSDSSPLPMFNWRHVLAGFAFGFLVAALLGFQFQEWRRKRMSQPLEGEEAAPVP